MPPRKSPIRAAAEIDALSSLESLADKSLVRIVSTDHGEPRFNRHAYIREYASELLAGAGERDLCERRHAMVYVALAEAAEPHLLAEDSLIWLERVEHERHNLRTAMRWSLTVGEPEVGLRIAWAIWRFWQQRAELREGRAWLAELLAQPEARTDSTVRVHALSASGGLAYWANDFAAAWQAYDDALAAAERLDDQRLIADANYDMGFRYVVEPDPARHEAYERRALELYEALGDEGAAVRARQALVVGAFLGGDRDAAHRLEELNLEAFRRSGSWYRTADSLTLLGSIEIEDGDVEAADVHIREALSIVGPRGRPRRSSARSAWLPTSPWRVVSSRRVPGWPARRQRSRVGRRSRTRCSRCCTWPTRPRRPATAWGRAPSRCWPRASCCRWTRPSRWRSAEGDEPRGHPRDRT